MRSEKGYARCPHNARRSIETLPAINVGCFLVCREQYKCIFTQKLGSSAWMGKTDYTVVNECLLYAGSSRACLALSYTTYVIATDGTTLIKFGVIPFHSPRQPSSRTVWRATSTMPLYSLGLTTVPLVCSLVRSKFKGHTTDAPKAPLNPPIAAVATAPGRASASDSPLDWWFRVHHRLVYSYVVRSIAE